MFICSKLAISDHFSGTHFNTKKYKKPSKKYNIFCMHVNPGEYDYLVLEDVTRCIQLYF